MTKESTIAKLLKKEEKKRNHQNNKQSSLDTVKIKEKYGDLIENTHVAVATIDKKGRLIYVNNGICSLSGYSKNELLGRPFVDFLHPDDKKKMIKLFLFALFKSKEKIHFEFRFIHKNGTIITCCTSPTIFRSEGKIKGFHAIIQDITRYKKTEEQLKNSEELYKNLIELAPDSIVTMNLKGYITSFNSAATRILGYSKDDLVGKHFSKIGFLHVKDIPKYLKLFVSILRGKGTGIYELTVNDKDGTSRIVETHIGLIKENNKISGIVAITRDITERKQVEDALQQNLTLYRGLIETTDTGFVILDQEGKVLDANQEYVRLSGHENFSQIRGRNVVEWTAEYEKEKNAEAVEKCFREGQVRNLEIDYVNAQGKTTPIEINATVVKVDRAPKILTLCRDITDRKKAEEALKKNHQLLNETGEMAKVGGWELDLSTNEVSWTEEVGRIHGVGPGYKPKLEEALNFYTPESRLAVEAAIKKATETGEPYDLESLFIPQGSKDKIWVRSLGKAVYSGGEIVRLVGTFQNIDKYKRAEEKIQRLLDSVAQERDRLSSLVNSITDEVWFADTQKNFILANPVAQREFGHISTNPINVEELARSLEVYRSDGSPRPIEEAPPLRALKGEIVQNMEEIIRTPVRGELRYRQVNAAPVRDSKGNIIGSVSVVRDITERKKIEKEVIESEEKLKQILDSSPDAITVTDLNGNIIECNQTASKMYGSAKAELIGKNALEFFSPKDREKAKDNLKKTLELGYTKNEEYTLLTKDGREYPAELSASLIKDASGNPQSFVAIVRDITERKKAEEEIKKERDFSKSIVDTAQAIVMVLNTEGKIVSFNPYMEELSGYKIDEVKGKDWFTTFLPEYDYDQIRHLFKKSLRGIQTRGNINSIIAKDSREILIEWYDKTLKDKDGKVIGVLAIGQDVTERKKTEEMLKKSEERYKRLFNSSPELILETDEEGNIFTINPMMLKSLGIPSEKLIGKNIFDILPKEVAEERAKIARKALKEMKNQESEDERAGRYFQNIYVPIIKPDGKRTVQLIARDVTSQKKVEEKIKIFSDAITSAFDCFMLTDLKGNITYANKSAISTFGYTSEEFLKLNITELDADPMIAKKVMQDIAVKERWGGEVINIRKNKEKFPAILSAFIIKDDKGNPIGTMGILRDITERKQAKETLAQQNEALSQLNYFSIELSMLSPEDNLEAFIIKQIKKITGAEVAIFSHYNPADRTLIAQHIEMDPGLLEKVVSLLGKQVAKIHSVVSDEMYQEMTTEIIGRRRTLHEASFGAISRPVGAAIQALLKVDRFIGLAYFIEGELYGTSLLAMKKDQPDPPKQILDNFIFLATVSLRRKRVENALQQSEEKYRILFNDVPVGISITDKSGHILDCNQYMAEIFRFNLEELKTINIKSLYMNLKDRERLLNLLNKEGRAVDWECSFKRKDGAVFCAILNVDVIDREGQKLNLTSLQDITERKVAEEKIRKQNVQLKKLDGVKTDFLNTTSHELRTPVASIKGYIQMLLKHTLGDISEEQKKALEVVLRNTNRLDSLIEDILDISRLESGTMKFITEKTDVTKMVKEIAETMQASADIKRIKIKIDIQKEIPDLMIDSERIKQVLMNLVDNAIKFSPDGSMIHIKARKEKEDVVFEVQDFGRGIPKNKQNKIFERFYQVDSGTDRKFGGIGLGLTISKKIIDTYGGQIWVDSIVGKGSSFKFSLPLQSTKDIEDDLQEISMELP